MVATHETLPRGSWEYYLQDLRSWPALVCPQIKRVHYIIILLALSSDLIKNKCITFLLKSETHGVQ